MEEFEGGNQTTTEQVETPAEQTQIETPATTQENYFTVKYNKEEVQVPYEQAPDYIQKGMNYDKVNQRVSEYENQLNRVAQLSGYQSHDELLAALDGIEQQRQREQYEQAGIDPDMLNQILENHPDMQFAREMKQKQEQDQKFQSEANELFAEFPDLKANQIPAEVWQLQKQYELQNKHIPLLDAYLRVNYKSLGQQKEQEAIQKLQQNNLSSTGSLAGGDVQHNKSISQMSKTEFEALQERVLRGDKIKF